MVDLSLDAAWQRLQTCARAEPPQPLIITGPTASGKTGLALEVAKRFDVEIVSADSALIYQGMDIGTAKPSAEELTRAPHHLINIMAPQQSYSAAQFALDAAQRIQDIQSRGKLPLVVGGTMLYIKALRDGLDDLPSADPTARAEIQARALERGWPALHQELALIDPQTAGRLAPLDAQRISRALEVYLQTGKPLSSFWTRGKDSVTQLNPIPMISLEPHSRAWLHERIAQRFHQMLELGLVDEVRKVYACAQSMLELEHRGQQHIEVQVQARDLPSMRCVGYRQVIDSIEGQQSWSTLAERGIAATRQLAKRQLTWLRGMERVTVDAQSAYTAQ